MINAFMGFNPMPLGLPQNPMLKKKGRGLPIAPMQFPQMGMPAMPRIGMNINPFQGFRPLGAQFNSLVRQY